MLDYENFRGYYGVFLAIFFLRGALFCFCRLSVGLCFAVGVSGALGCGLWQIYGSCYFILNKKGIYLYDNSFYYKSMAFMEIRKLAGVMALCLCVVGATSCNGQSGGEETEVVLETTAGDIRIKLYNDTPGHRDNFIRNVKEGKYDGVTFHRVVRNFMVQTGDPDTKEGMVKDTAKAVETIAAEIVYPKYFHKKGMVAAARENDDVNPERRSDRYQFYIVTGKHVGGSDLSGYESANYDAKVDSIYNAKANAVSERLEAMRRARNRDGVSDLLDSLLEAAQGEVAECPPAGFTKEQRRAYETYGGAPWLDGKYSVFGEVVEGMKVVGQIERLRTDRNERPLQEIRIKKARIVE